MFFKQILTGGDRNFGYLIADEASKEAAIVDPSYSPQMLVEEANKMQFKIKYIINTHDHCDHTNGNKRTQALTGARIVQHAAGNDRADINVKHGDSLWLGTLELRLIHTPGHTPDSMCILAGNKLCTGDTLFVGKVGGTDLGKAARQEYDSLHEKLMCLADDVEIYPGHNYGVTPTSTIGNEKHTNPFLLQPDFDSFVDLKRNWAEYKRIHGIK
ncbi:MBL fold metallo-hydrolase [candidate division KSB1 bacterium]|nr:MBL fold metallo-hydrolase [candidate division KSB1 bacterium]